jgi:hypothetical protein
MAAPASAASATRRTTWRPAKLDLTETIKRASRPNYDQTASLRTRPGLIGNASKPRVACNPTMAVLELSA